MTEFCFKQWNVAFVTAGWMDAAYLTSWVGEWMREVTFRD